MRRRAEAGKKDTAFNHLLYFIQYQRTGHIEQANEQIRKAEVLCNEETDITIRSQILINRGVAYVLTKAYKDAEDAFEKAILFARRTIYKRQNCGRFCTIIMYLIRRGCISIYHMKNGNRNWKY